VFRSSPLPEFSGEPIYKTGDKASYLPDGNIEFFGRDDQQVKLHGVRVELRDVETVLGKHPSIRAVVVMARDDVAGDKRLVAYFTACDGPAPAAAELRTFLAKTLPQAFIPSAFVCLDAFTLTQNGKIDRRALPAPPTGGHDVSDDDRPTTPMELIVGDAWKKLLGVREVSCTDNFYDLGGSSLLAAQVIAAVEASTGVRIEAQEMFFQTLGQLASFCDSRSATATAVEHKAPGLFQRLADGARRLVGSGGRA
jgi:acyl carrier protein